MKTLMVTGGAGFIGSNFLNLFVPLQPEYRFINFDKLTYAANLLNLQGIEAEANYEFVQGDINVPDQLEDFFARYQPDLVVHFAAESHVDRSIYGPADFIQTNIMGTFNLLEVCRKHWQGKEEKLFLHVSTDEVYGSLGDEGLFSEDTAYDPSSPYAASKASSDHLVRAYCRTYGLPAVVTNCSNNYGPYQFPEKLIPLMITNALENKALPVYGDGANVRDWLYVDDHNRAIWMVLEKGRAGETYNVGGFNECKNLDLVNMICEILADQLNSDRDSYKKLITFVKDRPGHDRRYAIDSSKISRELGWKPEETLESGIYKTVRWYLANRDWLNKVRSGEFRQWIARNYDKRAT